MNIGSWSIKKVFLIVQAVVTFLVITSMISVSIAYYHTERAMADIVDRYERLNDIFQYNAEFRSLAREYLFHDATKTDDILARYDDLKKSLLMNMNGLIADAELSGTRVYLSGLQSMFLYYEDSIDAMIDAVQSGAKSSAYRAYNEAIHRGDLIKEVVVDYNALYSTDVNTYAARKISEYGAMQLLQTIAAVLLLVTALLFCSVTLYHVQRNIRKLVRCTEHIASGDYDYAKRQQFPENSDWGALGISIRQMSASIQYYIGEMVEKNRLTVEMATMENERLRMYNSMREAELRALDNQMSPHVIYNTLNIALQLAYEEKAEKTIAMMRAIIEFLRYCTKNASAISDLYSEVEFLRNYIYISQKRYGSRIRFQIDMMDGIENVKLPAVIIQPLVENAILHGMKDRAAGGSIHISIKTSQNALTIAVEDNGCGIAYDKLEELLSAEPGNEKHVGLPSVERRLKLFFGEDAAVSIDSELGLGTIVTLSIPLEIRTGG